MDAADVLKAIGLVSEMANGIARITAALQDGLTKEQLEAFIADQNRLQGELREQLND